MTDPVLVEVTRGGIAESEHRGAIAVVDSAGKVVLALGDIDRPVFPRSAIKGLQAIPLIESGAADKFGLTDEEIALACASHNGEERHVATALSALRKAGCDVGTLECGAQFPMRAKAGHPLIRAGLPATPLHNNCSGKHAGFICTACATGADPHGYVKPDHPTMRNVTAAVADMTGFALGEATCGTDGCSIPTFAIPLKAMAFAFAKFGSGQGLDPLGQTGLVRGLAHGGFREIRQELVELRGILFVDEMLEPGWPPVEDLLDDGGRRAHGLAFRVVLSDSRHLIEPDLQGVPLLVRLGLRLGQRVGRQAANALSQFLV